MPIHPNARRCTHIRLNGKQCGSPAVTGAPYCHFHCDVSRRRRELKVPVLQTNADVQQAITETIRALIEGRIDRPRANSIFFGLQLAQKGFGFCTVKNLKHREGEESDHSVIQRLLDEVQPVQEHENEQEAQEIADAGERELLAADVRNTPKRTVTSSGFTPLSKEEAIARELEIQAAFKNMGDTSAPHHWTDDIATDEHGHLKLTKEQEEHLDQLVMENNTPMKTG